MNVVDYVQYANNRYTVDSALNVGTLGPALFTHIKQLPIKIKISSKT